MKMENFDNMNYEEYPHRKYILYLEKYCDRNGFTKILKPNPMRVKQYSDSCQIWYDSGSFSSWDEYSNEVRLYSSKNGLPIASLKPKKSWLKKIIHVRKINGSWVCTAFGRTSLGSTLIQSIKLNIQLHVCSP